MHILAINPGSTSTKIAIYNDETCLFDKTVRHDLDKLNQFDTLSEQYPFRRQMILDALTEAGFAIGDFAAIVGRGGLLKPISGGTYRVNEALLADAKRGVLGQHASNLGGVLAYELATPVGLPAFIVDPVVVDEMEDIARISGHPLLPRRSIFHALNQKATARKYAKESGRAYEDLTVIVAHLGGGVSVGLHHQGRVVDVNNALDGEGPFSPERSGALPTGALVDLCFSGEYSQKEVRQMLLGKGGFVAYFQTNDLQALCDQMDTDPKVKLHIDAMAYQTAKEICALSAVVCGKLDGILLTGGICYSDYIVEQIKQRVSFLGTVHTYPGENEMEALALGALRVMRGEYEARLY